MELKLEGSNSLRKSGSRSSKLPISRLVPRKVIQFAFSLESEAVRVRINTFQNTFHFPVAFSTKGKFVYFLRGLFLYHCLFELQYPASAGTRDQSFVRLPQCEFITGMGFPLYFTAIF